MHKLPNTGENIGTNLEILEGNVYLNQHNHIKYIYGDKDAVLRFEMPNTNDYTICALVKYNGSNMGTILGDDTSFIGHWNNTRGYVNINNTAITTQSTDGNLNDWLIILYNNSLQSTDNVKM